LLLSRDHIIIASNSGMSIYRSIL